MPVPQFFLALADHNNNQLYFSPSKTLSLAPNVTVEELRHRVQQIHDITCVYYRATRVTAAWKCTHSFPVGDTLLDGRPAEAVKLNDEDPLALHFPVRAVDDIPRAIELIFDIEKLDPATVYPALAADRAHAKKLPKIIHEHTRKKLGNGVYTNPGSSKLHLPSDEYFNDSRYRRTRFCWHRPSPPSCGKSTWLSTLAYLNDIHHAGYPRLVPFSDNIPLPEANQHHIVRLDLAEFVPFARTEDDYIPEDSSSDVYSRAYMYAARALKDFVCEELRRFFDK
ncbi:hypothetical protein ARMSODRAFT_1017333 [Armillaria solidipes]|uniref:Uncharacterized protein n=1 Tax=Armillaria solidipes TaxID=1076256 RepID=A0A2H3BR62_9AGAR|nr:hypothetical protein ARMSODRAFT_1017333 [Armillaria solidipes]